MDVDFSNEARKFLNNHSQKDDVNASLEERVSILLESKVKLHNDNHATKVTLEQLKSVFNRGQAVTDWIYCANKSSMQWAFARVNKFLHMQEGQKVSKAYRISDRDIAEGELEYETEDHGKGYFDYTELDFAVARLDIKKACISEIEADKKLTGLVGLVCVEE